MTYSASSREKEEDTFSQRKSEHIKSEVFENICEHILKSGDVCLKLPHCGLQFWKLQWLW